MDASMGTSLEQSVGDLAAGIRRAGWRAPALLLLDAADPLGFVGRQALLLSEPLWGDSLVGRYARTLHQPEASARLLTLLALDDAS